MKTTTFKLAALALAVTLSHAALADNNITGTGNETYQISGANIYGDNNNVRNENSHGGGSSAPVNVFGDSNSVEDSPYSTVIGNGNSVYDVGPDKDSASSDYAFVAGNNNSIGTGQNSTTIGNGNTVTGTIADSGSVLIGTDSTMTNAKNGIGFGTGTTVTDANSIAIGAGSSASDGAVAIGANSVASRENSVSFGSSGSERQLTNVAAGTQATDAVNVSQLTATNDNINNIYNTGTKYFHTNSTGADSSATGIDAIAIGMNAVADVARSVALGDGAVTSEAVGTADTTIAGNTYSFAGATPVGTLSVGAVGDERTITNVAAGRLSDTSTDAVNGSQLYATNTAIDSLSENIDNLDSGSVKYDKNTDGTVNYNSITLGGSTYDSSTHTGGTRITNVADGVAASDAVNVSQLNDGMNTVINEAKNYTDTKISEVNENINQTSIDDRQYTDNSVHQMSVDDRQYTDTKSYQAETNANNYTDMKYQQATTYTDTQIANIDNKYNAKFSDLKKQINRAEKRLNAGIAGVTAIASIPYVTEDHLSYGIGLGNYQNGNAGAAGIQYKTSMNTNVRVNVSWDSSHNNAVGVGFAGGW